MGDRCSCLKQSLASDPAVKILREITSSAREGSTSVESSGLGTSVAAVSGGLVIHHHLRDRAYPGFKAEESGANRRMANGIPKDEVRQ